MTEHAPKPSTGLRSWLGTSHDSASSYTAGVDGMFFLYAPCLHLIACISPPAPIVDKMGLVGILAGSPADAEWPLLHLQACDLIAKIRPLCTPCKGKKRVHPRGVFVALCCGISHGIGQVQPKNLDNTPSDTLVLEQLNTHPFFKRVAGFATGMYLCSFFPLV